MWVYPKINQLGHKTDHSPSYSARGKNTRSYISTPPYLTILWRLFKHLEFSLNFNYKIVKSLLRRFLAVLQFLVTANVPSPLILSTLVKEATQSFEASVLTWSIERHIPEDGVLHSHRRENFKSYIALTGWAVQRKHNVSPVRYELRFYIPENGIFHIYPSRLLAYLAHLTNHAFIFHNFPRLCRKQVW
jgi:hypothetical protein